MGIFGYIIIGFFGMCILIGIVQALTEPYLGSWESDEPKEKPKKKKKEPEFHCLNCTDDYEDDYWAYDDNGNIRCPDCGSRRYMYN